jgi:transcriptional regulator with XRE-family HTH domain
MKLFINYGGPDTGSGKIRFTNIHEVILIEEALKYYKESLTNKATEKNMKPSKKIGEIDKLITDLQIENAEKLGKKYDSSLGVNLNQFLITRRHKSKILLKEIADKLKISPSYYNDIEKENVEAPAEILLKIFEILEVVSNINVKLYQYIPTIVFFYKDIKMHEVFFESIDKYNDYSEIIKQVIPSGNIEVMENKIEL